MLISIVIGLSIAHMLLGVGGLIDPDFRDVLLGIIEELETASCEQVSELTGAPISRLYSLGNTATTIEEFSP